MTNQQPASDSQTTCTWIIGMSLFLGALAWQAVKMICVDIAVVILGESGTAQLGGSSKLSKNATLNVQMYLNSELRVFTARLCARPRSDQKENRITFECSFTVTPLLINNPGFCSTPIATQNTLFSIEWIHIWELTNTYTTSYWAPPWTGPVGSVFV